MAAKKSRNKRIKIRPKTTDGSEQQHWSQIRNEQKGKLIDVMTTIDVPATPGRRQDGMALSVRFWHKNYDMETIYFGVDGVDNDLPDRVWDYVVEIIAVIRDMEIDEAQEFLDTF